MTERAGIPTLSFQPGSRNPVEIAWIPGQARNDKQERIFKTVIGDLVRNPDNFVRSIVSYFVYILASERNGTLYTGMTNDLKRRVCQHKEGKVEGFTKQYHVKQLVYFERYDYVQTAIGREKQLKWWKRKWKLELIEKFNPQWRDLSETL